MSLLDDARKLAETCPSETDRGGRGECFYCSGRNYEGGYLDQTPTLSEFEHKSDCPVPSMPKIVAALEAAEEMHDAIRAYGQDRRSSTHDRVVDALEAWRAVTGKMLDT